MQMGAKAIRGLKALLRGAAILFGFFFLFVSIGFAGTLEANRDLSLAVGSGFLARHEYEAGKAYLQKHLESDPGDAASWNTLGLIFMEMKAWEEAELAFNKAASLSTGENQAVYYYNAADAANRRGNSETTLRRLSQAESAAIPSGGVVGDQISRIRNTIKAGEPMPPLLIGAPKGKTESHFSTSLSLKGGYDSNVTLLPDSAKTDSSPASSMATPLVQVEFVDNSVALRSLTAYTQYSASEVQNSNNLFESIAFEWVPPPGANSKAQLGAGERLDLSWVNTSGLELFSWTNNFYVNMNYQLGQSSLISAEIPLGYQKFPYVVLLTPEDNRDGYLIGPTFLYRQKEGLNSFSGGLTYQKVFAIGNNYKSDSFTLLGGFARPLTWGMGGRLGIGITRSLYPESSLNRTDTKYDLSFQVSKIMPFNKKMSVSFDLIHGSNSSNVESSQYNQNTFYLQVNYAM